MTRFLFVFALLVHSGYAQLSMFDVAKPKASGAVWLDLFGGRGGAVVYPWYAWEVQTPVGAVSGVGFVEGAPHEPLFANNLVLFTPARARWFSAYTETGGLPNASPRLGFFQAGPRINLTEVIPGLKRPLHHLWAAPLPRFIGIRPNNLVIAGGSNRLAVNSGLSVSVEGFRRFFPGHRPDYAEYWFLAHPARTKPVSFALFVLHDGGRASLAAGIRIAP